jgi:hypothetical protein
MSRSGNRPIGWAVKIGRAVGFRSGQEEQEANEQAEAGHVSHRWSDMSTKSRSIGGMLLWQVSRKDPTCMAVVWEFIHVDT